MTEAIPTPNNSLEESLDLLAVTANSIADQLIEAKSTLRDLSSWLRYRLLVNLEHRSTGKGGHDGDGNSWSVCAIPEWECRQKLAAIEQALRGAK